MTPGRRDSGTTSYVRKRAGERRRARAASRIPELEGRFWAQSWWFLWGVRWALGKSNFLWIPGGFRLLLDRNQIGIWRGTKIVAQSSCVPMVHLFGNTKIGRAHV